MSALQMMAVFGALMNMVAVPLVVIVGAGAALMLAEIIFYKLVKPFWGK